MEKATRGDYWRVLQSKKYAPQVHKIPCKHCGYYNDPRYIRKLQDGKYYRCVKCGNELKTEKQEFADKLLDKIKEKENGKETK